MTKDEALRMALEALEGLWKDGFEGYPAVLHEQAITAIRETLAEKPAQRKPLTDEEIWDEVKAADLDWQTGWSLDEDAPNRYTTFARAIEAAHGIKE